MLRSLPAVFLAFRPSTWRRTAYALVAVPAVFLGPGAVRRLLGVPSDPAASAPGPRRILVHALLSLPLNAVTLAVTVYVWLGLALNLGYPVRVGGFPGVLASPLTPMDALEGSWGGPTLAGAWAVHAALGGLVFGVAGPWMIYGLTWLQGNVAGTFLRGGPTESHQEESP